jgi:hypothetical protein
VVEQSRRLPSVKRWFFYTGHLANIARKDCWIRSELVVAVVKFCLQQKIISQISHHSTAQSLAISSRKRQQISRVFFLFDKIIQSQVNPSINNEK